MYYLNDCACDAPNKFVQMPRRGATRSTKMEKIQVVAILFCMYVYMYIYMYVCASMYRCLGEEPRAASRWKRLRLWPSCFVCMYVCMYVQSVYVYMYVQSCIDAREESREKDFTSL